MTKEIFTPLQRKIYDAGIRHFKKLIHDQPKEWLIKNFRQGADKYPINVACLMRNIIWQTRERILKKEKPSLNELVRTFWYMYIKPTLSRAGALSEKVDQYAQLVDQLVYMVKELNLMNYENIGFKDENQTHRATGANANVVLFSEKIGHHSFISEIAEKYKVSIIALGGQPSLINLEYFVRELQKTGINLRKSFYLFSIVDFDTSGWIIRDAFISDLAHYGIKNIKCVDLITPDILTPDEVLMSRYSIPASEPMKTKNQRWVKQVKAQHYKNQKYILEGEKLYGLESEAVSTQRLTQKLQEVMVPILGKDEEFLRIYELRLLNETVKQLMVHVI